MKAEQFNQILEKIEQGSSLRNALKSERVSSRTFYEFLEDDEGEKEKRQKQYARACEIRTQLKYDSIEDDYMEPPKLTSGGNVDLGWVQHKRLVIDSKKWQLSKENPKKYGDKVDLGMGDLPKDSKVSISLNLGSNEDATD